MIERDPTTQARKVRGGEGLALRIVGEGLIDLFALPREGELSIGRAEDCDIQIDDPSISRRHALLSLGERVRIQDLGGANGTRVGERVLEPRRWTEVSTAEVIDLGSVMLILMRGFASAPAPSSVDPNALGRARRLVERVAPADLTVLLQGETGVGKEVFAELLHARSKRAAGPLLRLNCGGFTETLLAGELFGYEAGAFTGADRAKPGLLESAHGGSVFLDEIGELPLAQQARLLRVLQDRRVQRMGALDSKQIDVRFIAATNRDLHADIGSGRFRADLYYRLNGVTIEIPPLRERSEEIIPLAREFAAGTPLTTDAITVLQRYPWPGNIRELRNVIEAAVLLAGAAPIGVEHLSIAKDVAVTTGPLRDERDALEKQRIVAALEATAGNQTRVARMLGISRSMLLDRIKQYGLRRPRK